MGQLVPLNFRPGINREGTSFSNEGGWWDCDKVRFRQGHPETIGGWSKVSQTVFTGIGRNLTAWASLDGDRLLGLATHLKYYVVRGTDFYDITPIRETTGAGDVTFSATDGSSIVDVADTGHGAILGDFVTFSGASSLGGTVVADVLNAEHQITSITDADNYQITVSVTANSSDTGNGGGSVVGAYQINTGLPSGTAGLGWGSGPWGDGGWGASGTSAVALLALRTWSHDNFGEDLIINPRNSGIYYWDFSSGLTSNRAGALSDLSGANQAPTIAAHTLVSDQDRHVICFGCDSASAVGTQDPLLIRWSDQENAAEWQPLTTNTAGDIRLSSGSSIVSAVQTKREILIFTDASVHSMQFIGPPYTFGIQEVGRQPNLISPGAAIAVNDVVYWMGDGRFMVYDGTMQELRCDVRDYVFSRMNTNQADKVVAGHNARFNEVWWMYQAGEEECDSYVIYNYAQDIWYFGTIDRTAWLDMGLFNYPIAASSDGYLYYHEFGLNDGAENPEGGIAAYIESSQQDIGDGGEFMFINRVIPDLTFRTSTAMPAATITLKTRRFPGNDFNQSDDESVMQSASSPVETWTEQLFVRLRGRSVVFRVESDATDTAWRLGKPRIEIRQDGRK